MQAATRRRCGIDTPFPDPRDPGSLAREAAPAARDGFAGKVCIYPARLEPVDAAFTPSAVRIAWTHGVVVAFETRPDAGVIVLDGQKLERMHRRLACRTLDLSLDTRQ